MQVVERRPPGLVELQGRRGPGREGERQAVLAVAELRRRGHVGELGREVVGRLAPGWVALLPVVGLPVGDLPPALVADGQRVRAPLLVVSHRIFECYM